MSAALDHVFICTAEGAPEADSSQAAVDPAPVTMQPSPATESVGIWQGVNHITLATPNLDATVAFYRDVLGLHVVFEAPANPMHGRHAMLSSGGSGPGLHFFEVADAQIFSFPEGVPSTPQFLPGALQHIALTVADEAAALSLRERLQARGIPTTPVLTPGRFAPSMRTFLFPDPSGLLIKAIWTQTGPSPT